MERIRNSFDQVYDRPLLSITKATLFLVVTTFALYLPLGDQYNIQWDDEYVKVFLCCLSDVYAFMLRLAIILSNMTQCALNAAWDSFHEVKLLFYNFLKKVDRKDLCHVVCCYDEKEEYVDVDNQEPVGDGDSLQHSRMLCQCVKRDVVSRSIDDST